MQNLCPNCFEGGFSSRCASCGYVALAQDNNQMLLRPGMTLNNRYIVGRALGAGGFGVTYLVLDKANKERMAVKEYLPSAFAVRNSASKEVYPSSVDSTEIFNHGLDVFDREAQSLRMFLGNPSVVQVTDSFRQNGTSYYVMEFLDGVNLKALARSMGGKLPIEMTLEVLQTIGMTLVAVHGQGLLHRDVSPENIFVTKQGGVKLIDFGATRFFVGERSRSLSVVLKPGFAPPEQYSSKGNQGPWTDVYALGATFLNVTSGKKIPDAPERLAGESIDAALLSAGLTPGMRAVVERALVLNYRERYQSVGEFMADIQSACPGANIVAVSPPAAVSPQMNSAAVSPPAAASPSANSAAVSPPAAAYTPAAVASPPASNAANPPPIAFSPPAAFSPSIAKVDIRGTPYVRSTCGGAPGDKWIIPAGMDMVIGRSAERCNIILDDSDVSRVHCMIRYESKTGLFVLVDMSRNGTFFGNGVRMERGNPHTLSPGEIFITTGGKYIWEVGVE